MNAILTALSQHLFVYRSAVNVGVVHSGEQALLIDIGDGAVVDALQQSGIQWVDAVLFTHHHRDQACGVRRALEHGAWTGAPEAERDLFEEVGRYWSAPENRWHLYQMPPHGVLTKQVFVDRGFIDGDILGWRNAHITVMATPGHTDGSVSYLVDVDGQRIAFCGDLIYGVGQLYDLYSLQKGFGHLTDYHGYMGAWREVIASLRRIEMAGADVLVPSHGNIIREPKAAIDLLEERLRRCYERYIATTALWHYFPELMEQESSLNQPLVRAPLRETPSFLRHVGTSWTLLSDTGGALVMDCGSEQVVETLAGWMRDGEIGSVEALWITHYHDDHVDAIPQAVQRFGCEVIAERSVAQVVSNPTAWRLPCLSPSVLKVNRVVSHGESWRWHEYTLTSYHFPGQSLYHSGLLVEGRGLRLFFCGDSFTPTGLDDYCAYNRNPLGAELGYDLCLRLLEELRPELVFNCHVDAPFVLTADTLRRWRAVLMERFTSLTELMPYANPNFGADPYWAFCNPYEQDACPGGQVQIDLVVTNYSSTDQVMSFTPQCPHDWKSPTIEALVHTVPALTQTRIPFTVSIPQAVSPGLYAVTVDIDCQQHRFLQFCEAIIRLRE